MKLITNFSMGQSWDDRDRDVQINFLLKAARGFVGIENNFAFWTDEKGSCAIVDGFRGDPQRVSVIPCKKIEDAIRKWGEDLAEWCQDEPDGDVGDDEDGFKTLRVEISDEEFAGGMHIRCFDRSGRKDHDIHILPLVKEEEK